MEKLTQNNIRVIRYRLIKSEVPDFKRLKKVKNLIEKEVFDTLVFKAIGAYQSLLENSTKENQSGQELQGVTKVTQ
jgi:hypothetical protein